MSNAQIEIDGKPIQTTAGSNLLQVARDNGINIPGLCYHKKLSPTGACRLCITKIKGVNGLVMACTVQVKDGMEVTAFDNELEETRKHTLEYLLAEFDERFDDTYTDELQELTIRYKLEDTNKRRYPKIHQYQTGKSDHSSPILTYDPLKCIKCFRCIKACEEVQGKGVLSFAERGVSSYIVAGAGVWKDSECDGCGECIQLCPTGAIVEKPNRNTIQLSKIDKKVKTTCPYCGVGCQLELLIQDGMIARVNGVEGVSPNDGRLCVKGRFGYEYVHSTERLTHPLIKRNGKFEKASWDEALELISSKFIEIKEKYGPDSLAGYASAKCTNEDNYIFQKFVRTVFGTNNIDYCTRLCHASTVTAMLRSIGDGAGSNPIEDFEKTECLWVTGNNIVETHPVTATYIKRGAAIGMKIIVVDPRWTPLVNYATLWLQPKLGTDVALYNGLINIIIREGWYKPDFINTRIEGGMDAFKELKEVTAKYTPEHVEQITTIPRGKLQQAAKIYATSATAMIATGMGMSQQVTGTHNVFCMLNMMLITGQIGRELCGIDPPRGQNNVQGATDVGCHPVLYPGYIPIADEENRRKVASVWNVSYESLSGKIGLTTVEIIKAANEGKIRGMYIMGENPMISDPNLNHAEEALKKMDFLVVQDIFRTETTEFADVILPASSWAEKNGTFVNSDRRVLRVRKAVACPGEAREDWRIVHEIAKRMGKPMREYRDEAEIFDEIAMVTPILAGVTHHRIENHGIQWPCPTPDHPGTATLYKDKFNTPSGKAKLFPVEYVEQVEKPSLEYPFILNSGRILYHYHSSTMSRRVKSLKLFIDESYVLMHPNDAEKENLKNGDKVKMVSSRGELSTKLVISSQVLEGELFMPWHFNESQVNRLTSDNLDPYSKIAAFKLSAVRIHKV